ncbi:hypothetical protein LRS58_19625 [Rhodococcus sp. BH2-1]|nr:hypothetical protein [Rhodococcus sp. BH2-1]
MKNLLDNVRQLTERRREARGEELSTRTTPITPWTELPDDPVHPTFENATRYLIAQRAHQIHHDARDDYEDVPITATYIDGLGDQVELGPWSLSRREARELADSLHALADALDAQLE